MPAILKFAKTNEELPLYRRSLSTDIWAIRMVGLHPAPDPLVASSRFDYWTLFSKNDSNDKKEKISKGPGTSCISVRQGPHYIWWLVTNIVRCKRTYQAIGINYIAAIYPYLFIQHKNLFLRWHFLKWILMIPYINMYIRMMQKRFYKIFHRKINLNYVKQIRKCNQAIIYSSILITKS